ncbi:MAG: M23 family metallopeptidase [Acidobacteriota bacterium]
MPRRLLLAVLALLLALPAWAASRVEVEQGGVARWDADGIEACGMDGRTYRPVAGTCYYPVDFGRRPSQIEIAIYQRGGKSQSAWLVVLEREFETQEIDFPDDRYVDLSPEDLARHHQEQAAVKPLFRRGWSTEPRFTLPLGPPAGSLPEGGGFGARRVFNGEPKNPHTGTDYAIPTGTPVLAVEAGEVVLVGEHFFSGLAVYVDHGHGLVSMSFHLSEAAVEAGSEVAKGDTVAKVGSTGRSTGPHLHLGLRWRGARIDPDWLRDRFADLPAVE